MARWVARRTESTTGFRIALEAVWGRKQAVSVKRLVKCIRNVIAQADRVAHNLRGGGHDEMKLPVKVTATFQLAFT